MVNHNIILSGKQQSKYIRSEWIRASVVSPCPVCGKPDNCQVSRSGEVAWCGRVSAGSIRQNGGGQYLHILSPGEKRSGYIHPSHLVPHVYKPVSKRLLERASKEPKLAELAELLGVSVVALQDLGVGYLHDGCHCWLFPERDAAGESGGLRKLTDDLVAAAQWAESTEVMISLLSVESQEAVTERLKRALEAVGPG